MNSKGIRGMALLGISALGLFYTQSAAAITIGGQEFELALEAQIAADKAYGDSGLGVWFEGTNKNVLVNRGKTPDPIESFTVFDERLEGIAPDSYAIMGRFSNRQNTGPDAYQLSVHSGTSFNLFGDNDTVLLNGTLVGPGTVDVVNKLGAEGQFIFSGLFDIGESGLSFGLGSTIYVQVIQETLTRIVRDVHTRDGTLLVYTLQTGEEGGGETEIPEPATLALLASGLCAGASRRKRRRKH